VLADFFERGGFAETGDVCVVRPLSPALSPMGRGRSPLPGVKGVSHFGDVFGLEVAQHSVFHVAEVAVVDEQGFALAHARTRINYISTVAACSTNSGIWSKFM
jgi:hypothetical protein